MNQIIYFSNERSEFLSRELGWKFKKREQLRNLIGSTTGDYSTSYVLMVGHDLNEIKILNNLGSKRVWVFLYADETYIPKLNFFVLQKASVIGTIRAYPTSSQNLVRALFGLFRSWMTPIKETPSYKRKELLFSTPRGIMFLFRKHFVSSLHRLFNKQTLSLVPGYTNLFAKAYCDLFKMPLSSDASLLEREGPPIRANVPRKYLLNFVGQEGKWWRQYAIWKASNHLNESEFTLKKRFGFGGTIGSNNASLVSAKEYVEALASSKFTLCPPGNYSYGSFRILEALAARSVPLMAPNSSWDASFEPIPGRPMYGILEDSWDAQFARLKLFSEDELRELRERHIVDLKSYFQLINGVILGYKSDLYY